MSYFFTSKIKEHTYNLNEEEKKEANIENSSITSKKELTNTLRFTNIDKPFQFHKDNLKKIIYYLPIIN